jgi:tRNA dimethylallyltransferase
MNNKIIVILGPTSSGKSSIAIKLAKKFSGEIISADSRQIYRGMDVGTGKISGKYDEKNKTFISENVIHYGINILNPKTKYSAAQFKKYADRIIKNILKRKKLPIICGGTGFWIKTIVDNVVYPEVKPNLKLRSILRNKSAEELFSILKKLDPERAKNIDAKNPVRLIRAIEICKSLGKVPNVKHQTLNTKYKFLQIGINLPKEKLHENIQKRLKQRLHSGMIEEVSNLRKQGLSWKKIQSFGLGYSLIPEYLQGKIKTKEELFEKIYSAEKDYAKRQMTWFKKDKRIVWINKYNEIKTSVKYFLNN